MMKKDQGNIACILETFPKVGDVIEPESKKRILSQSVRAANAIEDPKLRKDTLLDIIHSLPEKEAFQPLFIEAMSHAIKAADEIKDQQHRVHALISLVDEIPRTRNSITSG